MFNDWQKKSMGLYINPSLFWEYENIDFLRMRHIVVTRIIERGWMNDFYAGIRIYGGMDNFRKIIQELPHLSDKDIFFVCKVFNFKKEELRCYTRKQLREIHLSF